MISVIIVNYNAGHFLTDCIQSILASSVVKEIFVSDNGSNDSSLEMLKTKIQDPRIKVVENGANIGFSKANNRMLSFVTSENLLFLNPDCRILPGTLEKLEEILQSSPEVGMVGCLIKNEDGSEQAGCRRSIPTPAKSFVRAFGISKVWPHRFKDFTLHKEPLPKKPVEVEAISGAFMLVKSDALLKVGPLDDAYFLHCEDLDWCMRFRLKGFKILFVPDVSIVHTKGVCSQKRPLFVIFHMHKGMLRYYFKFFRKQYSWALMCCVFIAVWCRFTILSVISIGRVMFKKMHRNVLHES